MPSILASQSVMNYFTRNIPKAHVSIGAPLGGVDILVNEVLPPDWMTLDTGAERRFFKLQEGRLVEMVPPAELAEG